MKTAQDHSNYRALHHRKARWTALYTFLVFLVSVELLRVFGPPTPDYLRYLYRSHIVVAVMLMLITLYIGQVKNGKKVREEHRVWVWYGFYPLYGLMMLSGAALVMWY